jgi:hypothetical protein
MPCSTGCIAWSLCAVGQSEKGNHVTAALSITPHSLPLSYLSASSSGLFTYFRGMSNADTWLENVLHAGSDTEPPLKLISL